MTSSEAFVPAAGRSARDGLPAAESPRRRAALHALGLTAVLVNLAYLVWLAGWTLAGRDLWLGVPFLVLEVSGAVTLALFVASTWDVDPPAVPELPERRPDVVALVATYNEDLEVLLPTVAAVLAMDGAHETWVLDDGDRLEVAQMTRALGARYVTRAEHRHAKAGNLNHALGLLQSELVAVFDADHVPDRDFLTRTLGYFSDPTVALVQTPQEFYNRHSFEHLGDSSDIHEESLFYRVVQAGKGNAGAAYWCGTNAVLRVSALRSVGGVATETLTEDFHTTLRLHRAGWRSLFHNEVLARGLAAGSPQQYVAQRLRWGGGAMQVLRTDNPLGPGLTWRQRVSYAYSLSAWFDAWRTLGLALVPVAVLVTGVFPVAAPPEVFVASAGGTFLLQQLTLVALSRDRARLLFSVMFDYLRMPATLPATLTLLHPGAGAFRVTDKGRTGEHRRRARVPLVLGCLAGVLLGGLVYAALTFAGRTPTTYDSPSHAAVSVGWLLVTLAFVLAAVHRVRALRFGVERREGHRFPLALPAVLHGARARVVDASMGGVQVRVWGDGFAVGDLLALDVAVAGRQAQFQVTVRARSDALHRLQFAPHQWDQLAALASTAFGAAAARSSLVAAEPARTRTA